MPCRRVRCRAPDRRRARKRSGGRCAENAAARAPRRKAHPMASAMRPGVDTAPRRAPNATTDAIHPTSAVPASRRRRPSSWSAACRRSSSRVASSARRRCSSSWLRSSSRRAWSRSNASFNAATTTLVSVASSCVPSAWPGGGVGLAMLVDAGRFALQAARGVAKHHERVERLHHCAEIQHRSWRTFAPV